MLDREDNREQRENWPLQRLKFNTYVKARVGWHGLSSDEHQNDGPFLVTGTDFRSGKISWNSCTHISDQRWAQDPYIQLKEGDLLVTKDGTIGKIAIVRGLVGEATLNSGIFLIRPLNNCYLTTYLFYIFHSHLFSSFIALISQGSTINHLYQRQINEFPFPLPPLPTQKAIANFLHRKTAVIDALIEKKEKLLKLLAEKRSALINQAVTKGLDPTVPMKDSGIPWIGEIPAHWEVSRLGFLARIGNGSTPSRDEPDYWTNGDVPWLNSGKVNDGVIRLAEQFVTKKAVRERHLPIVQPPSIVMGITGEGQTRGRVALLEIPTTISQHLAYISPTEQRIQIGFLWQTLQAYYNWLRWESSGGGSTKAALTCQFIRTVPIILPPSDEQARIVRWLKETCDRLASMKAAVTLHIEKLREYRQALITAAVTGQLDIPAEDFE